MIRIVSILALLVVPIATTPCWGQTRLTTKLLASDAQASQVFGNDLAVEGHQLVVGAFGDDSGASSSGAVYLFELETGRWMEQVKLKSEPPVQDDLFGSAVAINGQTLAVGALGDSTQGELAGAVHVYREVDGVWSVQQLLLPSNPVAFGEFGGTLAIDGTTLFVGAAGDDSACPGNPDCFSGAVYLFEEVDGSWTEIDKLVPSDGASGDFFGRTIALDGTTLVVESGDAGGSSTGAAYVFEQLGGVWTEAQKLLADDGAFADEFGRALDVMGSTILVGAPSDDDDGNASGSAYVFEKAAGVWTQNQKLTASDASAANNFGWSLSIHGGQLAISSPGSSGMVYLFGQSGSQWVEQQKLIAADPQGGQRFGDSMDSNVGQLAISAIGDDTAGPGTGAVYIFSEIFSDGFESGDTSGWSSSTR